MFPGIRPDTGLEDAEFLILHNYLPRHIGHFGATESRCKDQVAYLQSLRSNLIRSNTYRPCFVIRVPLCALHLTGCQDIEIQTVCVAFKEVGQLSHDIHEFFLYSKDRKDGPVELTHTRAMSMGIYIHDEKGAESR